VKISLRAVHVLAVALLTGGAASGASLEALTPWVLATFATGLLLLAFDLFATCVFVLQVRGLVVFLKLAAFVAMMAAGTLDARVLGALILVSVISSHAPSRVRYYVLLGRGRVRGDTRPG
jgi:hypothetical protein